MIASAVPFVTFVLAAFGVFMVVLGTVSLYINAQDRD
jgi:hypothetical protein